MIRNRLYIILLSLIGCAFIAHADECFELENYYNSKPTNYAYRGGDGWAASNASVAPTSSMYFSSPYDYVMLTGGNKNTAPGQLQVEIHPSNGVGMLTFLIAKPCISDNAAGASVVIYADGTIVANQLVVAYSTSYQMVSIPINQVCGELHIMVTNFYTNRTTSHNNRIAFAHFCWTDYVPPITPPEPPIDTTHTDPPVTPPTVDTICLEPIIVQTDTIICANESFEWFGKTIANAGQYSHIIASKACSKCDSIKYILTVHVLPTYSFTETYTICPSSLPFSWKDDLYFEAGTYYKRMTTKSGCDSLYVLNLQVLSSPIIIHTDTTICEGRWLQWRQQTLMEAGTYFDTIHCKAYPHCDSIYYSISLSYSPISRHSQSVSICEQALPYSWNGKTYTKDGEYHFVTKNSCGCDSVATLYFSVKNYSATDTTIWCCPKDLPYSWKDFTFYASGEYTWKTVNVVGCDSMVTCHLYVSPAPSHIHSDTSICGDASFIWHKQIIMDEGTYYDTLRSVTPSHCDSIYYSIKVTRRQHSDSITIATICHGESFTWHGKSYRTSTTEYETLDNAAGCDSICTLQLTVLPSPTIRMEVVNLYQEELPYKWRNKMIWEEGEVIDTIRCISSCDSIYYKLRLHVLEPCEMKPNINMNK